MKHMCMPLALMLPIILGVIASVPAQNDSVVARAETPKANAPQDDIPKVARDPGDPAIVLVKINGETYRVNTTTRTVELVPDNSPSATASAASTGAQPQDKEDMYAYEKGDEPFDYRLVNVPTPRSVPKGSWNLSFTHRFSQPLRPFKESSSQLFGLDSMSSSSFGLTYGITDKLYFSAYRSPVCQRALCRTIEFGVGYHLADQTERSPVALSLYASVEGNNNFRGDYTYNFQAMIARRFGKRVFVFFSPALHLNANGGRRFDPDPTAYSPKTVAENFRLPRNSASFGFGTSIRITPNVSGIFEFTPRTGFKLGHVDPIFNNNFEVTGFTNTSRPEIGYGLQYTIGKHSFTLVFSNTQTTTTSRYNSSNLLLSPKDLVIGFNIFRRW